jgi:MoaA/NifB/PqqE/SkfB family radical SAM enzyme
MSSVFLHPTFQKGEDQKIIELAKQHGFRLSINNVIPAVQGDLTNGILMTFGDNQKLASLCQTNDFITTHMTNNFFGYGCPIGNCYLGLTPYGDVLPCFFVPISFGNVWNDSLKNIFKKMLRVPFFKARPKLCLSGEHKEFITDYMSPIFGVTKSAPMPVEAHPKYDPEKQTLQPMKTPLERTPENHILP